SGDRSDVKLIDVPNTLRLKAKPTERERGRDVMTLVREAHAKLFDLRLKITALQMRLLAHFALRAAANDEPLQKYLSPMGSVARQLAERLAGASDNDAATTAVALEKAVAGIGRGEDVLEAIANLSEYASTLHAMLNADRSMAEREEEFARAVKRISER